MTYYTLIIILITGLISQPMQVWCLEAVSKQASPSIPTKMHTEPRSRFYPFRTAKKKKGLQHLSVPEPFGSVVDRYDGDTEPSFILIHDSNADYQSQRNILRILKLVLINYQGTPIGLESSGSSTFVDFFRTIDDPDTREKLCEQYLKKGLLSAAEALSVTEQETLTVDMFSLETSQLYLEHFQLFREIMHQWQKVRPYMDLLRNIIFLLKTTLYPKELLELEKASARFREKQLSLVNYILRLYQAIEYLEGQGFPVRRLIRKGHFTVFLSLENVLMADRLEKKISYPVLEQEKIAVRILINQIASTEIRNQFHTISDEYRRGLIAPKVYFQYLTKLLIQLFKNSPLLPQQQEDHFVFVEKTYDRRLIRECFPNFFRYQQLLETMATYSHTKILTDLSYLEENIFKAFIGVNRKEFMEDTPLSTLLDTTRGISPAMKLLAVSERFDQLYQLLHCNFSTSEYQSLSRTDNGFVLEPVISFLKNECNVRAIYVPDSIANTKIHHRIRALEQSVDTFYRLSIKRQHAVVEKCMDITKARKNQRVILITSKEQSLGLSRILKEQGFSYVQITPRTANSPL